MKLYPKNKIEVKEIKKFIVIFYIIGFLGFIIPATSNIFIFITPFALLLCIYLLALFHTEYTKKGILIFVAVYILGLGIEVIGVNTGVVFGDYYYGKSLGPKVLDTPLLIGLNWLFLTYTSTSIFNRFRINKLLKILLAACLMVLYDVILEQVAAKMDIWYWEASKVPFQNYVAWYGISFVFVSLIQIAKINTNNKLSTVLFLSQFCFLLGILFFQ